jgi:Acetoacetate decarboxylase (ADC)
MKKRLLCVGGLGLVALGTSNYLSYKKKGTFREFHGIFAALETENVDLYSSFLREPMQMPEKPIVALFVIDYVSVGPWPMARYQEGTVALRCKHSGVDGWHVKTMPVTKLVPNYGGRMLGFPKYVADDIPLRETNDGWLGEVRHQGKIMLSLQYARGATQESEPLVQQLIEDGSLQLKQPLYLFVPPDKGSRFQKVMVEQPVHEHWESEAGSARVSIDESEPWAGLIPPGTEAPAFFQRFTGGAILKPYKLS